MTLKAIASRLAESGVCVCPGFVSERSLLKIADDFNRVRESGRFQKAGVGRGEVLRTGIRDDEIFWLDRNPENSTQKFLWKKIDLLRFALNRTLFLGLNDFEGHYATYPAGGHYDRHRDCFRGDSGRVVSFVLYLNRFWKPEHGGQLRIFTKDDNGEESFTDIEPTGGTMVCFMSAVSDHEVLLSQSRRDSLTGWFKR